MSHEITVIQTDNYTVLYLDGYFSLQESNSSMDAVQQLIGSAVKLILFKDGVCNISKLVVCYYLDKRHNVCLALEEYVKTFGHFPDKCGDVTAEDFSFSFEKREVHNHG